MASAKYDEDVYENPFFTGIMSTYPHVLEKIVQYKGTLCVPKFSVTSQYKLSKSDAMDHVLLPRSSEEEEEVEEYITASGKTAEIRQGKVWTGKGFDNTGEVMILFAETFHTDAGGSYKVLCLDGYLNKQKTEKKSEGNNSNKTSSPTSYQQCMDLLWSHSGGQKTRDTLDKLLQTYSKVYERLEGENLRSIVDAASTHFAKAMQLLLKDSVVRKSARHNPHYMDNLKLAVETYAMNGVHKRLFRVITAAMSSQDSEINKITRNIVDLQLSDLGIRKIFNQNIPPAKKELSVLNRYSTPMGRLFCLKRIVTALSKPPRKASIDESGESSTVMTSDDLLPILIFLIVKSDIPNWYANLVYMRHFHFAKTSDDDEFGFYLATVEAALEHIKTGNIQDEIQPFSKKRERWNSLTLVGDSTDLSPTEPRRQSSSEPSVIEEFFRYVQEGDEKAVQTLLEKPHKASEEIQLLLCHPLCSCDRCDKILSVFRTKSDLVTAYTRDNRGYTALHMAAYYGQGQLIDLLVQNNAVVDSTDYLGLTPLHLACQRGHQNVMLLLLHFNADVMSTDNEGNTPLHLGCANGHEDCVKALVFYDASVKKLQVNAANEMKDTALHLAAKWGFEGIVKTLLESGADASVLNRKGQTPASLAQNVKVQRLLQMAAEGHNIKASYQGTTSSSSPSSTSSSPITTAATATSTTNHHHYSSTCPLLDSSSHSSSLSSSWSSVVETASLEVDNEPERKKKKEKLFKAIIEGDFQLVKFYLGVSAPDPIDDDYGEDLTMTPPNDIVADICHPLCQCSKCVTIHRTNKVLGEKVGVNIRTSTGSSPLHTAVLHNHSDIVELLISLHADTSAQNHKSLTPLHLACCMRNSLMTDMLVKAKSKLDVHDINGDTPLLIASSNGFINGVHSLIKAGADTDAVNIKGNSALHEAARRNLTDTMGLLVRSGIDTALINKDGKTAADIIKDAGVQAMIQEVGVKVEFKQAGGVGVCSLESSSQPPNTESQGLHSMSIKELFAAFEESDLHTLQSLTASIRSFDKGGSLKRATTRDASRPFLSKLTQAHSITRFDKGNLRKVKLLDKSDPLYIYSLSCDDSNTNNDIDDSLLTPMGDKLSKTFNDFPTYYSGQPELSNLTITKRQFSNEKSEEMVDYSYSVSSGHNVNAVVSNFTENSKDVSENKSVENVTDGTAYVTDVAANVMKDEHNVPIDSEVLSKHSLPSQDSCAVDCVVSDDAASDAFNS